MTNPDQSPTIAREPGRVRVLFEGHDIADSDDVVVVHQPDHPPTRYFPRKDVFMVFLSQTDKVTRNPDKGDARYFTIYRDQHLVENVAWSYEAPHAAFADIAGRIAFHPEHVEFQAQGRTAADTAIADEDVEIDG
ncbi:DUF427 domain-containing protein [Caulobacter sp. UNC279MFTsu5.1]|uniref:DUF427 domain-containing protein n=1 Tax=Caulobacter sp. UNC279MFTsu5.1 TaxID=1502775 RepID=UPI0003AB2C1A|nr:DUF427 domain-containing protein [Caulobacter sp. UNC279MFTsu5.1]SFJ86043.1 Uncharacterized conserved protein, DUF427 family [Caulobacter sp. UNC279MFTsu5.1]